MAAPNIPLVASLIGLQGVAPAPEEPQLEEPPPEVAVVNQIAPRIVLGFILLAVAMNAFLKAFWG